MTCNYLEGNVEASSNTPTSGQATATVGPGGGHYQYGTVPSANLTPTGQVYTGNVQPPPAHVQPLPAHVHQVPNTPYLYPAAPMASAPQNETSSNTPQAVVPLPLPDLGPQLRLLDEYIHADSNELAQYLPPPVEESKSASSDKRGKSGKNGKKSKKNMEGTQ